MRSNPTAAAAKWANAMAQATPAYTAGVQAVTTAPGQLAAAQQATYIARVTEKAPIWAQNVAAVGLQSWMNSTVTKGAPRLASGAAAAQPKVTAFMTALLPFEQNLLGTLPPRGNTAQNQARMNAWFTGMQAFKKPAGT
jgi:hypothetical protein